MKSIFSIIVLLAASLSQAALAGPIQDRLIERAAMQKSGEGLENSASAEQALSLPKGVKVLRDISYGSDIRQRFDVYVPDKAKDAPVIFMVHGGAWSLGDKGAAAVVENKVARWAPAGFIFISVNYRLLPEADPLQQTEDVARAFAAAQAQARSWGGDPSKFILMGHSAGAHLAALLAATPSRTVSAGVKPWLGTILLDSAAYDVEQIMEKSHLQFFDSAFGKQPAYWRSVSPFRQLSAAIAPSLAVCSTRRADACPQARAFIAKAVSFGARAEVLEQDLSHREINENLGTNNAYTKAVEVFMGSLDASAARMLTSQATGTR
jgi:arylformamidase